MYARTYPRVAGKNAEFYARYPDDVALVRRIADHLDAHEVRLPDGDRLTTRRLRLLGNGFGMSDGLRAGALAARGGLARRASCRTGSSTR